MAVVVVVVVLVEIPTLETASLKGFESTSCSCCDCPESEFESVIIYTQGGGEGREWGRSRNFDQ